MRDFLLALFGLKTYVTNLQILNEQLAFKNEKLANDNNQLRLQYEEQKANSEKLYAYTNELKEQQAKLESLVNEKVELINSLRKENQVLSQNCGEYNRMMANFVIEKQQLRERITELEDAIEQYKREIELAVRKRNSLSGTISALKKKLAKYEAKGN